VQNIDKESLLKQWWYYSIEYEKGKFTPGGFPHNVCLTREALRRTDVKGKKVLDIGTMEGLMSVLAARQGASQIVSTDRYAWSDKIDLVKSAYDVSFHYLGGVEFPELQEMCLRPHGLGRFDVVLFSGILYHMYNFMDGFSLVRSLVKPGGIVIIETLGMITDDYDVMFNGEGFVHKGDPHNYFSPSVKLVDYLCRFFAMRPIDVIWLPGGATCKDEKRKFGRFCLVCRVEEKPIEIGNDPFIGRRSYTQDENNYFEDSGVFCDKQDDYLVYKKYPLDQTKTSVNYEPRIEHEALLKFPEIINETTMLLGSDQENSLRLEDFD
jgi:SAM-dependent methyltransferase